jgi:hypothetical protein
MIRNGLGLFGVLVTMSFCHLLATLFWCWISIKHELTLVKEPTSRVCVNTFLWFTKMCWRAVHWPKHVTRLKWEYTRWFKYDRDWLCVNKPQSVPVIFEPPCTGQLVLDHKVNHIINIPILFHPANGPVWPLRSGRYLISHELEHFADDLNAQSWYEGIILVNLFC